MYNMKEMKEDGLHVETEFKRKTSLEGASFKKGLKTHGKQLDTRNRKY